MQLNREKFDVLSVGDRTAQSELVFVRSKPHGMGRKVCPCRAVCNAGQNVWAVCEPIDALALKRRKQRLLLLHQQ